MGSFRETLGINDINAKSINSVWKALLAEYLGNLLLNFFGCGAVTFTRSVTEIALTFGFTIFIVVQALGHVSGAHINPAVTAGMLSVGNITIIKAILYVIVQCLGAVSGSAVLKAMVNTTDERFVNSTLGNTQVADPFSPVEGFGIEFFLGFVLVLTVCGVCDQNRPEAKAAGPLAIGLAVTLGHLMAINCTGSSMNPARSFGSAVIAGSWDNHWVYWVGPILGGVVAALLYKNAFQAPSLGPVRVIERYTTSADEKELRRLDGGKDGENFA